AAVRLQPVQQWCVQHARTDCLAVRYRIRSTPVFGTLLAALSDDSERMKADSRSAPGASGSTHGSFDYPKESDWPKMLANGFFEDPTSTTSVAKRFDGTVGTISEGWSTTLLRFLGDKSLLPAGRRLVLLAEVDGEPAE